MVLKSAKKPIDDIQPSENYEYKKHITNKDGLLKHLKAISTNLITSKEAFQRFLTHIAISDKAISASLSTGEALLQQPEYLALVNLQSKEVVPEIYGACGHLFASQYVPTYEALKVNSLFVGLPWTSIGKLSFLKLANNHFKF